MSLEILTPLKRVFPLPTGREASRILIAVLLLAAVFGLAQVAAFHWVTQRFELGSISFPLALAPVTHAGDPANLIGWGYMLNPNSLTMLQWLVTLGVVLSLAILAGRLLWWAPVLMAAGGTANLLELVLRGAVLDWIIIPKGATVGAISVGDVALYIGAVWGIVDVAGNSIRTAREVVHAARGHGTKSEMS